MSGDTTAQDSMEVSSKDDVVSNVEPSLTDRVQQERTEASHALRQSTSDDGRQEPDASTKKARLRPNTPSTPHKRVKNNKQTPQTTPKQRYSRKWDAHLVVTDSKSPLTKMRLLEFLRSDEAWTALSPTQQRELMTYLPPAASDTLRELEKSMLSIVAEDQALPNIAVMRLDASMAFKADVRQFQEELRQGKLDTGWTEDAMRASARRKRGEFDDWKAKERENRWALTPVETGSKDDG